MIEELLDFYFETRISTTQSNFVTKAEMDQKLHNKVDLFVFNDYVKR